MPQLKVQNFYSTILTSDIVGTGDTSFTVTTPPTYTSGFIVISPSNAALREIVYFHNVVGSTISVRAENRGQGGTIARGHTAQEPVAMKDIAEIFNMFSDSISQCFFVEKTGGLNIKVWGGTVFYNGNPVTVADTTLALADNQTNYIKYSYPTNTISVDTVNSGNIKARVITLAGVITSIQYYVAKESYIDFTVTINGALPAQTGQSGKVLGSDGTNASWVPKNDYALDTGVANAYVVTIPNFQLTTGSEISVKIVNANTSTSTINVSGTGVKTIKKNVSSDIASGDILAGQIIKLIYDGTNFQLVSDITPTAPSNIIFSGDKYLLENVADIQPISAYNISGASETPLASCNLGDITANNIITMYGISTGVSGNTVQFYTNKVAAGNNFMVRAVTVDGSGVATTTQVHANAIATLAPASVTAGGVTTVTFPGSFTCGVTGTKFAWQVCQGTFGTPVVNPASYYTLGYNYGDNVLFPELSTNGSTASPNAMGTRAYCLSMVAARRCYVRGFNGITTLTAGTAYYIGVRSGGLDPYPQNQNVGLEFAYTVQTTGTNHIFPVPIILEPGDVFYVRTDAIAIAGNGYILTPATNADISSATGGDSTTGSWAGPAIGFITRGIGEIQVTSTMADTIVVKKTNGNDQLSLLNHIGYSSGAGSFGALPKSIISGAMPSTGLSLLKEYFIYGNVISDVVGVFRKSVGRAISSNTITLDSGNVQKNAISLAIIAPIFVSGRISYDITTAAASTYTLSMSYDLKTWTTIDSIVASTTITNKQITLPPCFIKGVVTGTVSVNLFRI